MLKSCIHYRESCSMCVYLLLLSLETPNALSISLLMSSLFLSTSQFALSIAYRYRYFYYKQSSSPVWLANSLSIPSCACFGIIFESSSLPPP
ncbi:hypothetical protein BJ878DRAFT_508067 [Calycina marina]|uniref:Uncharacterized protein n=1 Tax=Calycina marina TaxID=1763456 RepID=A0A9P8CER2_9HELO|nr:hypothetical protein BJ878DRAFT_508067 [Calycina marina]